MFTFSPSIGQRSREIAKKIMSSRKNSRYQTQQNFISLGKSTLELEAQSMNLLNSLKNQNKRNKLNQKCINKSLNISSIDDTIDCLNEKCVDAIQNKQRFQINECTDTELSCTNTPTPQSESLNSDSFIQNTSCGKAQKSANKCKKRSEILAEKYEDLKSLKERTKNNLKRNLNNGIKQVKFSSLNNVEFRFSESNEVSDNNANYASSTSKTSNSISTKEGAYFSEGNQKDISLALSKQGLDSINKTKCEIQMSNKSKKIKGPSDYQCNRVKTYKKDMKELK